MPEPKKKKEEKKEDYFDFESEEELPSDLLKKEQRQYEWSGTEKYLGGHKPPSAAPSLSSSIRMDPAKASEFMRVNPAYKPTLGMSAEDYEAIRRVAAFESAIGFDKARLLRAMQPDSQDREYADKMKALYRAASEEERKVMENELMSGEKPKE